MNTTEQIHLRRPRKWLGVLLAIIMPGLGQVYNGSLIKGTSTLICFALIPLLLTRLTLLLPLSIQLVGFGLAILSAIMIYVLSIIDTVRAAPTPLQQRSYNRWFFYLTMWLMGISVMVTADGYMRENIVEAYKIVTNSMAPYVLEGDYIIANKTAYDRTAITRGDIIIHVYLDDRSKVFIRQIAALPGETITLDDNTSMTAPHGTVLVKGFSTKKDPLDSRTFGPVDMRDIVGKVEHVYFSKSAAGIRWNRIGMLVDEPEK